MKNIFLKILVVSALVLTIVSFQKDNQSENLIEEKSVIQKTSISDVLPLVKTKVSIDDVFGNYMGVLHNVEMNGKEKKDVKNVTIHIIKTGENEFNFIMDPFKVGKMPGELSIFVKKIKLKPNGTFSEVLGGNKGLKGSINMRILGNHKYDTTLIKGKFTGRKLEFTLECAPKIMFVKLLKIHIEYKGKKK